LDAPLAHNPLQVPHALGRWLFIEQQPVGVGVRGIAKDAVVAVSGERDARGAREADAGQQHLLLQAAGGSFVDLFCFGGCFIERGEPAVCFAHGVVWDGCFSFLHG
jgi:hypothetical protein